jgi:hypothetical protein
MDKKQYLILIVIFDIFISLAFITANWYIWDYFNGKTTISEWGPFQMVIVQITSGGSTVGTYTPFPNYVFLLFWLALVGNFTLLFLALREKTSD